MKGLGKSGWASEVEVELLREGETQEAWRSQNESQTVVPIVIDLDAAGDTSINDRSFAPAELREWLANIVTNFGGLDPVILRPKPATPLATLDRSMAAVVDAGLTRVHMLADTQLERAYSVRLHGSFVRLIPNVDLPDPAPDSPK